MSGLLAGRRILITGAARGIGLAFAEAALAQGARVALADVDGDLVQRETERLAASDSPAVGLALDVCDQSSITAAAAEIDGRWGGLDALVNNAAVSDLNPFQEISLERWQQVLAVNLSSVLQVGQGMLDLLRRGRSAAIVNTVSTQAFFGQPRSVAYATAKGGLLNLTRCMAVDLGAVRKRVQ